MACRLDSGEDLGTGFGIEFVSVEAEEETFADSFRGGLRVLFKNGRFNARALSRASRTPS
jgi:hypothetical protein